MYYFLWIDLEVKLSIKSRELDNFTFTQDGGKSSNKKNMQSVLKIILSLKKNYLFQLITFNTI